MNFTLYSSTTLNHILQEEGFSGVYFYKAFIAFKVRSFVFLTCEELLWLYKIFPVAKNELGDFREYFDDPREQNHETWDIIITNIFLKNTPHYFAIVIDQETE